MLNLENRNVFLKFKSLFFYKVQFKLGKPYNRAYLVSVLKLILN